MTCPYADHDASYVLGALDPNEQQSYRAHLTECEGCRTSVDELAPMRGHLARLLPVADSVAPAPAAPGTDAPPGLLPDLAERVRTQRRMARWRVAVAGVVVAAAAATAGAVVAVPEPADNPGTVLTMSAEPGIPVEATLLVTGRGWGTSIDTRCRYDGSPYDGSSESTYELYAIDEDGSESLVSSWRQLSGREITVPGSTRLDLSDIDRLEVRTVTGETILRTDL